MQLIWIHQWTALPVIVEDPKMSERTMSGSKLFMGQTGDASSAQQNLGEKDGYSGLCQSYLGSLLAARESI